MRKEYIHPRATLIGRWVNGPVPELLIFVTELVAFFQTEGPCRLKDDKAAKTPPSSVFPSRTAYGLVKTRTDGHRFFVYTDSGNADESNSLRLHN